MSEDNPVFELKMSAKLTMKIRYHKKQETELPILFTDIIMNISLTGNGYVTVYEKQLNYAGKQNQKSHLSHKERPTLYAHNL